MKKITIILAIVFFLSPFLRIQANAIVRGKTISLPVAMPRQPVQDAIPLLVDVKALSAVINGTSMEYPLYVSEINSGLIYYVDFTSANEGTVNREFYFSRFDSPSGEWTEPINIAKDYSKFREENEIMNYDVIYITIDENIYSVDFNKETFDPQPININTKNVEDSPSLSPDGSTLYFVSDRPGSIGGKDIWASERLSNGKWCTPYNLGKSINTTEDEESPFIMTDGATLSFSSKGHYSNGGYDIYTTTQNYEGLWEEPENLGAPVNSTSDDFSFITDSQGIKAFYSSDKMEKNNQNIYNVVYNKVQ